MLQECRCSECNKLLGKVEGRAEIMCTRCKVLNAFNVPIVLREELETKWYCDSWATIGKRKVDADSCSQCNSLSNDGTHDRCKMYGNAIILDVNEKNCEQSVR